MSETARIPPQRGVAFELGAGESLVVTDVEGEQVADLVAFSRDGADWFSSGRTVDYNDTIFVTTGHTLYSNRSGRMLTIMDDHVGRHDLLLAPCSPEMFSRLYNAGEGHPSCDTNLAKSLAPFGITGDRIPTTFNIFMNVEVGPSGAITIKPPRSRAGDSIRLLAEMDLVIGLTACSAGLSNNWRCKPIDYRVEPRADPFANIPATILG